MKMDHRLKIKELEFSARTKNALLGAGIEDISMLLGAGEIDGLGKQGWIEIANALAYYLCSLEIHIPLEKASRYDEIVRIVVPNA